MKNFTKKFGLFSLALLMSLAERGALTLADFLEGRHLSIGRAYERALQRRGVSDYYRILTNINKNSARTTLWRLTKKGLVKKNGKRYFISNKGIKLIKQKLSGENENQQKKWDGKWRLVTFDVPEKNRQARNWLRTELYAAGYQPLQKSVFIGKMPLDRKLMEEILRRNLYRYTRLVTFGEIDDDSVLEKFQSPKQSQNS